MLSKAGDGRIRNKRIDFFFFFVRMNAMFCESLVNSLSNVILNANADFITNNRRFLRIYVTVNFSIKDLRGIILLNYYIRLSDLIIVVRVERPFNASPKLLILSS